MENWKSERLEFARKYYDGKCFACEKKFGKNFQFHHLRYHFDEKLWKDFKNPEKYWQYLSEKIKENPDRFLLLCKVCHSKIDKIKGGLSRMKYRKQVRLFLAVLLTEKV